MVEGETETEEEEDCFFSLEYQLKNLNDDLTNFEHSLNDYDNMLKNLDTNSESELDWFFYCNIDYNLVLNFLKVSNMGMRWNEMILVRKCICLC